jgi:hypothetical protein
MTKDSQFTLLLTLVLTISMELLFSGSASAYLNERLERAKKMDLFAAFRLEQTGSSNAPGGNTLLTFKPAGQRFRPLVTVLVTTDNNNRIQVMELNLARSFVEDRKDGIFARDIAKSLLRSAIPKEDRAAIENLANEIEFDLKDIETPRLAIGAPPVELPAKPTPGYLTFLGKQPIHKEVFSKSRLLIENTRGDAAPALRIVLAAR